MRTTAVGLVACASIWWWIYRRRRRDVHLSKTESSKKLTRPVLDREEVRRSLLGRHYRETLGDRPEVSLLPSYDDLNFLVVSEDRKKYVLKIFSSRRGCAKSLLMENAAMRHIAEVSGSAVAIPRIVGADRGSSSGPLKSDGIVTYTSLQESIPYYVRLLTFVPGRLWAELSPSEVSNGLLRDLGRRLGHMDKALETFDHEAAHRLSEWDLSCSVSEGFKCAKYIRNAEDRAVARAALSDYQRRVAPVHERLRWRVIHGDANDYNICVEGERVSGIFDFGDMVYSPLVHNLAIAIAYACMRCDAPVEAATKILAGYLEFLPLTEEEIGVLYWCVRARLAQSVCKSAHSRSLEPNNAYLGVSERNAWVLLKAFGLQGYHSTTKAFRIVAACRRDV